MYNYNYYVTEKRLKGGDYLESHSRNYFLPQPLRGGGIEDDHKPFLERGITMICKLNTVYVVLTIHLTGLNITVFTDSFQSKVSNVRSKANLIGQNVG